MPAPLRYRDEMLILSQIKGFPNARTHIHTHINRTGDPRAENLGHPELHSMNLFNGYFKFPLTNHQYANAVPIKLLNGMCFAFYHKGFN